MKRSIKSLLCIAIFVSALILSACSDKSMAGDFNFWETGEKNEYTTFIPYEMAQTDSRSKWGYANDSGEIIVEPKYDMVSMTNVYGLIAPVKIGNSWGFVNEKGETVVKLQYRDVGQFVNGYASVNLNGRWGYISEDGSVSIEPRFNEAYDFDANGTAMVCVSEKWGIINTQGNYVIDPIYDNMRTSNNGLIEVWLNGCCGLIDSKGNVVVEPKYDDIGFPNENGIIRVEVDGKSGFIDSNGNYVLEPVFDIFFTSEYGPAAVRVDDKWGYVDLSTATVVIEPIFDSAGKFDEYGLASVEYNGGLGLINTEGEFVVDPIYDYIRFENRGFWVAGILRTDTIHYYDVYGNPMED